jgi:predicted transcriptional regulator
LEKGYKRPIVLVRPEPEFASFFGRKEKILEDTVSLLSSNSKNGDFTLAVFPRTENQMQIYKKYPVTIISDAFSENPVAHADLTIGAAETMLMEAFVLGKPSVSTVYWDESKPLRELHKHIPHTTDPKEAAAYALKFLDSKVRENFRLNAEKVVNLMENPLAKIEEEIRKFYGGDLEATKTSPKRRSQIEIYISILRALAFRSLKLTHIMQEANLSYTKVKRDVAFLKKRGLVEEQVKHDGESYFRATPEGLAVLSSYERIEESLF